MSEATSMSAMGAAVGSGEGRLGAAGTGLTCVSGAWVAGVDCEGGGAAAVDAGDSSEVGVPSLPPHATATTSTKPKHKPSQTPIFLFMFFTRLSLAAFLGEEDAMPTRAESTGSALYRQLFTSNSAGDRLDGRDEASGAVVFELPSVQLWALHPPATQLIVSVLPESSPKQPQDAENDQSDRHD